MDSVYSWDGDAFVFAYVPCDDRGASVGHGQVGVPVPAYEISIGRCEAYLSLSFALTVVLDLACNPTQEGGFSAYGVMEKLLYFCLS